MDGVIICCSGPTSTSGWETLASSASEEQSTYGAYQEHLLLQLRRRLDDHVVAGGRIEAIVYDFFKGGTDLVDLMWEEDIGAQDPLAILVSEHGIRVRLDGQLGQQAKELACTADGPHQFGVLSRQNPD